MPKSFIEHVAARGASTNYFLQYQKIIIPFTDISNKIKQVNGEVRDLNRPFEADSTLELIKFDSEDGKHVSFAILHAQYLLNNLYSI